MTQDLVVETDSIRTALEAMRQAEPLGIGHPLAQFLSLRGKRGISGGMPIRGQAAIDAAVFDGLSSLIRHHLNRHRSHYLLPAIGSDDDTPNIKDDFKQGNSELEAWSFLYYRYVRVDLDLSLEALERLTRQDRRTLNRRQARGIARLTHDLLRRESRRRARHRAAALRAQLPRPYPPPLLGRDALFGEVIEHLQGDLPRQVLFYGPPGIGKTTLALSVAHHVIDAGPLDALAWIDNPDDTANAIIEQIRCAVGLATFPQDQPYLGVYLQHVEALVVVDNADSLLRQIDVLPVVLKAIGAARVILCVRQSASTLHGLAPVYVSALDRESAVAFMERRAAVPGSRSRAKHVSADHFNRLYNDLGGNPLALQNALAMGARYRPGIVSVGLTQEAWDGASRPARLLWLTLALFAPRPHTERRIAHILPMLEEETLQDTINYLSRVSMLDPTLASSGSYLLTELGRAFAWTIFSDPTLAQLTQEVLRRAADFLAARPASASVLRLLKVAMTAMISDNFALDLAYAFAPAVRRSGAWWAWSGYLEKLYPAASGDHRLWIGLQIGIAQRWLAQWDNAAYSLSGVIEEAGRAGAFKSQADAMVELAVVERNRGHHETAKALLGRANSFYARLGLAEEQDRVASESIQMALDANDLESAQQLVDKAFARVSSARDDQPEQKRASPALLILAATLALRSGKTSQALNLAEQALPFVQRDRLRLARLSALLGQIHFQLGENAQAILYLSGALDIMTQRRDALGQARARMNLGAVYLGQGNFAKALAYFRDLPPELERLGDLEGLRATLKNLELLNRVASDDKANKHF